MKLRLSNLLKSLSSDVNQARQAAIDAYEDGAQDDLDDDDLDDIAITSDDEGPLLVDRVRIRLRRARLTVDCRDDLVVHLGGCPRKANIQLDIVWSASPIPEVVARVRDRAVDSVVADRMARVNEQENDNDG